MSVAWAFIVVVSLLISAGSLQRTGDLQRVEGGCPERNGRFPDPTQCDAYVECEDGVASYKLCPDGLLFSTDASHFAYPCKYPAEVDCRGRSGLQPAQPTEHCPHRFGYFRLGDSNSCGQFMICSNGIGHVFDCPEGLAYNERTLRCDWPDQVDSCNVEAYLGFSCPDPGSTLLGNFGFSFYRSPVTCQKYYLCINGRPRLLSCSKDEAFNEITGYCDDPRNVTGCAVPVKEPSRRPQQSYNTFQNEPLF